MAPPLPPRCVARPAVALQSSIAHFAGRLTMPGLRCSERYVAALRCANRTFVFSRNSLGDSHQYETLVRTAADSVDAHLSEPAVAFALSLNMSHNVAFLCERGKLHAYGGMTRTVERQFSRVTWIGPSRACGPTHGPRHRECEFPLSVTTQAGHARVYGGRPGAGILHSEADAAAPTLAWAAPKLMLEGDKDTGCIDNRAERCECTGGSEWHGLGRGKCRPKCLWDTL